MRGREFTMKDAYSFDRDEAGAAKSYQAMYAAYVRIFDRFGPAATAPWRPTPAPSAATVSHEFQVIADTGEDAIVYCPTSDYAANIELAEALPLLAPRARAARRRWPRRPRPARAPARTWPRCWACRCSAPSSRWCWPPTSCDDAGDMRQDHGLAAAGARRPRPERGQGRQARRA